MESRVERACHFFMEGGYNCAESILLSFLQEEDKEMVRLATPFGGGIGREKDLCGILTGGVMVIGLYRGRVQGDDDSKFIAYDLAQNFYRWFGENFRVTCREILPGPFKEHQGICQENLRRSVCYLEQLLHR